MRHCWKYLSLPLAAAFTFMVFFLEMSFARGMMGGEHMRGMMQQMMGDMLPPAMDPAFLPDPGSKGARLLQQYCAQCHNLPGPGLHTAAEWPAVAERMNRRMRMMSRHGMMMGRIEAPNTRESTVILDYLQAHAQKPLSSRLSPLLQSEAGKAFSVTCSQCHALPDPAQHSAAEWPAVVERMKKHMAAMGRQVPEERTMRDVVGFLQRHGRGEPIEPD